MEPSWKRNRKWAVSFSGKLEKGTRAREKKILEEAEFKKRGKMGGNSAGKKG